MTVVAAVDGSALGNPGPAGWAWYIDEDCWAAGGWPTATNNRGELQAVIELLAATAHLSEDLHILCDSKYVINAVTSWMPGWKRRGWKKADGKPVLNRDLLETLDAALQDREVEFEWVRGHSNHALNEAADTRARAAAGAYQQGTEVPAGPGFTGLPGTASTDEAPAEEVPAAEEAPAGRAAEEPAAGHEDPVAEPSASDSVTVSCRLPRELADEIVRRAGESGLHPQAELVAVITAGMGSRYSA